MKLRCSDRKTGCMTGMLCVFLLFFLFIQPVLAAQTYTEGYYYYELKEDAIVITGYFGEETEITLPERIAGYPVSEIAAGAFIDTTVKLIHLPDTIMSIGENAFPLGAEIKYASDESNGDSNGDSSTAGSVNSGGGNSGNGKEDVSIGIEEAEIEISNESKLPVSAAVSKTETGKNSAEEEELSAETENRTGINSEGEDSKPTENLMPAEGETVKSDNSSNTLAAAVCAIIVIAACAAGAVLVWKEKQKGSKK